MNSTVLIGLALAVVVAAAAAAAIAAKMPKGNEKNNGKGKPKNGPITQNRIGSEPEQIMFWRLIDAFENQKLKVLMQVSFAALVNSKDTGVRNTFDRKRAYFVLIDKGFNVIAVIELDDASHKGRKKQDDDRSAILSNAGYRVVRYTKIPDIAKLQADFAPTAENTAPMPLVSSR